MGDIFCLVILESGSRRKLKLQEGTYDELLASLRGLTDVVLDNTLIQIFDADLEDFVDLLPDETIENKAKLRIIQKTAPTPKRISNAAWSNGLVTPSHPLHNDSSGGPMPCPQPRPSLQEEANGANESMPAGKPIKMCPTEDNVEAEDGESICRIEEVFSQAPPEQHENNADQSAKSLKQTISNGDNDGEGSGRRPQRSGASAKPDVEDGDKESEDPVARMSQVRKMLQLLVPCQSVGEDAESAANPGQSQARKMPRLAPRTIGEVAELAANPGGLRFEPDPRDFLKFKLPSSFGCVCDLAFARKIPVSKQIKGLIIGALFKECMKVTMYPSRRLYRKAIDDLVTAHPHLIEGHCDYNFWVRSLKSKFKNVRRRLPEGMLPPIYPRKKLGPRKKPSKKVCEDSEQSDHDDSSDSSPEKKTCSSSNGGEPVPVKNTATCLDAQADAQANPSSPADSSGLQDEPLEEVVNGLSSSATPLKELTVFELLDMCTREPMTPKKLFRQSTLEWHDDEEETETEAGGQSQQISEEKANSVHSLEAKKQQPQDPDDYLRFELPSLGIYEESVEKKAVVTGRMRRYIVNCLFETCFKITKYPSSRLYRTAVDRLIDKYPHLKDTTGETGREIWTESLRAKFKNVRRTLPGHMWDPEAEKGERAPSAKRLKSDEAAAHGGPDVVKRAFREPNTDFSVDSPAEPVNSGESFLDQLPSKAELLVADMRHASVREMSVSEAIMAFPSFKQEPSLLAEFKTLWRRDLAECFEKGITQMLQVLMKLGTADEVRAITQADESDILMVVLNVTAARCGEKLDSLLTESTALPTPCLVKRADGSLEVFVGGYFLFTASSLLGGVCALFATFWVFHLEYPKNARGILTFLEHAFLDLRQTKPHVRCHELINLYRSSGV